MGPLYHQKPLPLLLFPLYSLQVLLGSLALLALLDLRAEALFVWFSLFSSRALLLLGWFQEIQADFWLLVFLILLLG